MIRTHTDILIAAFVASVSAARQQPQNKPSSDQKKDASEASSVSFATIQTASESRL